MRKLGPPLGSKDRLLLRLPSWLGDVVSAEPILRALHERQASGRGPAMMTLAGPRALVALLASRFEGVRVAEDQRWGEQDVALLMTGSFRSAWAAWRAGIPRRVGWARDLRGWLLTDHMTPALERGAPALGCGRPGRWPRYLPRPFTSTLVELVGLLGVEVTDPRPRLAVASEADQRLCARLESEGILPDQPMHVIQCGGRAGSAKRVPEAVWARSIEESQDLPGQCVLVTGPGEDCPSSLIRRAVGQRPIAALMDPALDLEELLALLARAHLVWTSDTGPRHLAQAVGAPTVCVLGPTDPRHHAENLAGCRLVVGSAECAPCHLEKCPRTGDAYMDCFPASLLP